jgi:hypothetical protein
MLQDSDGEIPFFSGNSRHFRQRQQFNIDVPADLDQFRRDNSHRTIIGRKGLVKLCHCPADGG